MACRATFRYEHKIKGRLKTYLFGRGEQFSIKLYALKYGLNTVLSEQ